MADDYLTDEALEERLNKVGGFLSENPNEKAQKILDEAWQVYSYWRATPEDRKAARSHLDGRVNKLEEYVTQAKAKLGAAAMPRGKKIPNAKVPPGKTGAIKPKKDPLDWNKVEDQLVEYVRHRFHEDGYHCDLDDYYIYGDGVFCATIYVYNDGAEEAKLLYQDGLAINCNWADAPVTTTAEAVKVAKERLDEEIYNVVNNLPRAKARREKKVYKTDVLQVYKSMAGGSSDPYFTFANKFDDVVLYALKGTMTSALTRLRGRQTFKTPTEAKKFYLAPENQEKFLKYLRAAGFVYVEKGKTSKS